jgi:hypothetical protein
MHTSVDNELAGRERSRLLRARANGYLNAMGSCRPKVIDAHAFWCWRMRIPLVWFERKSPRSKYGRVHLDLFTTANLLSDSGQAELVQICQRLGLAARAVVSPYEGLWEHIPVRRLEELARTVFRVATRLGNYDLRQRAPSPEVLRSIREIGNVLPWRKTA